MKSSEERSDGIRTGVQGLRVPTATQQGRGRGERGDDHVVDGCRVKVAAERQAPFEIPSRSMSRIRPQAKSSVRGIGEAYVSVRRSPRPPPSPE